MPLRYLRTLHSHTTWRLWLSGVAGTLLVLILIVLWHHVDGIYSVYTLSGSITTTLRYSLALFIGLPNLLSWFTLLGIICTTLLVQLNMWLLLSYRREFVLAAGSRRTLAASASGLIAGIFGVGCAACGTTLLLGFLGTIGGLPLLALLPWQGSEFLLVGIIILFSTTIYLLHTLSGPRVCLTP